MPGRPGRRRRLAMLDQSNDPLRDARELREAARSLTRTGRQARRAGRTDLADLALTRAEEVAAEADRLEARHHNGHPVAGDAAARPGAARDGDDGTPCPPGRSV